MSAPRKFIQRSCWLLVDARRYLGLLTDAEADDAYFALSVADGDMMSACTTELQDLVRTEAKRRGVKPDALEAMVEEAARANAWASATGLMPSERRAV